MQICANTALPVKRSYGPVPGNFLNQDEEKWGLAGLLHDLDAESHPGLCRYIPIAALEMLRARGVQLEIIEAIRLHNEAAHPDKRSTLLQHALAAGETVTGLIIASALVRPDRQLASVQLKSVRKRFRESAAPGCRQKHH